MTAPAAESTKDTESIGAEDADFYRYYRGRIKDLCADIHAARRCADYYQALGDSLATQPVATPSLGVAEDYRDIGSEPATRRAPVGDNAQCQLELTLRDASRQAYVFAGHYRRAHTELGAALQGQVDITKDPGCAVLTLDETGFLGYNRAGDEWLAGSVELGDRLSAAAYWLQGAGLLPRFDECFATPAPSDEDGCQTCKADGKTDDCPTHGGGIELGTTVTGDSGQTFGTITGVLVADEAINGLGRAAIRVDGEVTPYAVLCSSVRLAEGAG